MSVLLVVDDELAIRHAFRRVFSGNGVSVLTAATAGEALAIVKDNSPDVVVLDVQLPGESGLELFPRIRELMSHVPLIFITGHATDDTAAWACQMGDFGFLRKPLELAELYTQMKS